MSSTVLCRIVNYYLSAPNPPFYILLYSLERCDVPSVQLSACQASPTRASSRRLLAEEITVLWLLSKSRHFTTAVGMVLVSGTDPAQLHPPNSLITFQRTIGNWPGPRPSLDDLLFQMIYFTREQQAKAIPRDLNPNLQGPFCKLIIPTSLFSHPLHFRGGSFLAITICVSSVFPFCFFNSPLHCACCETYLLMLLWEYKLLLPPPMTHNPFHGPLTVSSKGPENDLVIHLHNPEKSIPPLHC